MPRRKIKKTLYALLILIGLWAAGYIAFAVHAITMHPQRPEERSDAIVVLTGGEGRVETGLSLFAAGRAGHLFITGVHPGTATADILKQWTGAPPLPPCCLTIDRQAVSTVQNAREARNWLTHNEYHTIRLVTSNYHMMRALREMHHALPGIQILAHPVPARTIGGSTRHFREILFIEYHKNLVRGASLLITPRRPLERGAKNEAGP